MILYILSLSFPNLLRVADVGTHTEKLDQIFVYRDLQSVFYQQLRFEAVTKLL
jgi:hypothetical protein